MLKKLYHQTRVVQFVRNTCGHAHLQYVVMLSNHPIMWQHEEVSNHEYTGQELP